VATRAQEVHFLTAGVSGVILFTTGHDERVVERFCVYDDGCFHRRSGRRNQLDSRYQ
jgi:hypothetical protein